MTLPGRKLTPTSSIESVDYSLLREYLDSRAHRADDFLQKSLLGELIGKYVDLERRVDALLKNTLPATVAEEIKHSGTFSPRSYDCSILFSDIAGFTRLAERVPGEVLLQMIDALFRGFDEIMERFGGTKIKTIGDAYMAVFGAPEPLENHAVQAVKTALAFQDFVQRFRGARDLDLGLRIGVHSGSVMAAVVGKERMQFDVFGDNVNVASRMESAGEIDRVNVSHEVYLRAADAFIFRERGEIPLKNRGLMRAYFVEGERKDVPQ
ncbi:MAG TPA: adenylate/guanylate cyclase domain-containing protein [Syntrophobacteraceae bacterium]|nr:adenylate/guanylate cyclase domain-containing protein [Syntrophobacteraceae bacterium]